MSRARRLLRAPALHFLVLGGALFALEVGSESPEARVVAFPASPTSVRQPVTDEELLLAEALALGLDRRDPLVRARLTRLGRVAAADVVEDGATLEREARRLGLERHDVVVRRHLVQVMELALARGGARTWPRDGELAAYAARHRARFVQPARVRFAHVFFARDRPGPSAAAAASRALTTLRGHAPASVASRGEGDAFLWGTTVAMSEPELARRFGTAFAAALAQVPQGRWSGPVRSSYGLHVVWVEERIAETMPSLASIRSRVVHAWLAERAAARLERRMAERRARARGRRDP